MISIMKGTFGFQDSQICRLRDDRGDSMPTRANMLKAMQWLTGGAQAGDEMFFHYSGHGGQMEDKKGDELDGKDETLIPCDFQQAGQITDDELHSNIVQNLPKGCRMWVVLDCCHSGSALDLRYKVELSADGRSAKIRKKEKPRINSVGEKPTKAMVIMLSGCKDNQTSADIGAGRLGVQKAAGAMTTAFKHTVTPTISCHKLLQNMRKYLKRNNFTQVPQLSSEQYVQLDNGYVAYEGRSKKKWKKGAAERPFALHQQGQGSVPPAPHTVAAPAHQSAGATASAAASGGDRPPRRRAVSIGINYIGMRCQLSGCINDSDTFIRLLTSSFGYRVEDIRQLRDDHPERMPTKKNMKRRCAGLWTEPLRGTICFSTTAAMGASRPTGAMMRKTGKMRLLCLATTSMQE
jgi:hypothetical protein